MRTPIRLAAIPVVAAMALLAACGSDAASTPTTTLSPTTTAAGATTTATGATTTVPGSTIAPEPGTTAAPTTSAAPDTSAAAPVTTVPTEEPADPNQVEITLKVGFDDSPTRIEQVPAGAHVVLSMQSDADEDYHLHGYDLSGKAAAGVELVWNFTADKVGSFELESHLDDKVLLVIQVAGPG